MLDKLVERLRRQALEEAPAPPSRRQKPAGRLFAAVTVVPGATCCHAARKLRKKRTLVDEAPLLPLPDCTQPEACQCVFEKHADRRAGGPDRRVIGLWQPGLWKEGGERRTKKGRRSSDR